MDKDDIETALKEEIIPNEKMIEYIDVHASIYRGMIKDGSDGLLASMFMLTAHPDEDGNIQLETCVIGIVNGLPEKDKDRITMMDVIIDNVITGNKDNYGIPIVVGIASESWMYKVDKSKELDEILSSQEYRNGERGECLMITLLTVDQRMFFKLIELARNEDNNFYIAEDKEAEEVDYHKALENGERIPLLLSTFFRLLKTKMIEKEQINPVDMEAVRNAFNQCFTEKGD